MQLTDCCNFPNTLLVRPCIVLKGFILITFFASQEKVTGRDANFVLGVYNVGSTGFAASLRLKDP